MSQSYSKQQIIDQLDNVAQEMLAMMQEQFKQASAVINTLNELRASEPVKKLGDMVSYSELVSLNDLGLTLN
jgi:hypothetical protein